MLVRQPFLATLFFADSLIIFCKATQSNAQVISYLLQEYGHCTNQHISPTKCKLYGGGTSRYRLMHTADMLGFTIG